LCSSLAVPLITVTYRTSLVFERKPRFLTFRLVFFGMLHVTLFLHKQDISAHLESAVITALVPSLVVSQTTGPATLSKPALRTAKAQGLPTPASNTGKLLLILYTLSAHNVSLD
jgi:hypothetical protein